ncbi:chromate transporter, partial [Vibrio sp.]|nr:chromate transporter [Vibrio sp.]
GIVHCLKLLAVVVVADAAWGMYKNFCTNNITLLLCLMTAIVLLIAPSIATQILVLVFAALIGCRLLKGKPKSSCTESFKPALVPLFVFIGLLIALPFLSSSSSLIHTFNQFFQAGSLVFGGGHVVLPLLQNIMGDALSKDAFLTGYAAAQAVPGPMFTLATYLGYELLPNTPILGAIIATLGVFLPGFLLILVVLKNWQALANQPYVSGALAGVNAAVVGLLIAALYNPVFTSAVTAPIDFALLLVGFFLLKEKNWPIMWLVGFFIVSGLLLSLW